MTAGKAKDAERADHHVHIDGIRAFALGGLAGVLYVGLVGFIAPTSASITEMFFVLAMVIIGGRHSLAGDPPAHRDRHLGIVDQISGHFRHAPDTVFLEPLAEPHDRLDPLWNAYLADTLTVARAQHPTRPILVGPAFFNTVRALPALQLPVGDRHLIVTLHHYWPLEFTFQGETWFTGSDTQAWLGTTWQPTPDRTAVLDAGFAQIAEWSTRHDRPIFLGEFGTTSHADMSSRAAWTRYNRELAEHHGFSWCYWSYGPSAGDRYPGR